MPDWRDCVNQNVGVDRISDLSNFISIEKYSNQAPIDRFYLETKIITSEATPNLLKDSHWLGSLYAVAMISVTENYFRQIFSRVLKICPISKEHAAKNSVNLGSVIWHPKEEVERGAFEHTSLASSDNIAQTSKKFIGLDLKDTRFGLEPVLGEFDKICELRHGVVHSCHIVSGKNGLRLRLPESADQTKISIRFKELQEICAVCSNLVVTVNGLLFEQMCKRWAIEWRNYPSWHSESENKYFKDVWNAFHSSVDERNGRINLQCTWVKCRNLVKAEFDIQ